MIGDWLRATKARSRRLEESSRSRRNRRHWAPEGLEDRVLLASPTVYTVNATTDTGAGTDTGGVIAGDIAYILHLVDNNSNAGGSLIQFDPTVFGTPQTITLTSTLNLSETDGPTMIDGPGTSLLTISGNNTVQDFLVDHGVTATLSGLTISGGLSGDGGGIENEGAVTVADCMISNNSITVVWRARAAASTTTSVQ